MLRSKAVVAGAISGVAVLAAAPAWGVVYATKTDQLIAWESGVAQARAAGNFYNYWNESAHNDSEQRDPNPGGDSVYVETSFRWYGPDGQCGYVEGGGKNTCWWSDTMKQTERTNVGTWMPFFRARNLVASASGARGAVKVCEDQSWSPDPCSATRLATFDY